MYLLPIFIPTCSSSSLAFLIMCSEYRLNKQGDNRQACCTHYSVLNQPVVPCRVLTVASWPAHRFLRRQILWSGISISLRSFQRVLWSYIVKGFIMVDETVVDIFLEFSCFLYDPVNVGNLISGSSAFSKPTWNIWKFLVHIRLKPSMQDFEQNLTSMGDECNCPAVSTFFTTALLGNWDEYWPFSVLWTLLGFPNWLTSSSAAL